MSEGLGMFAGREREKASRGSAGGAALDGAVPVVG
jgi:hypothetical protein